MSIQVQAQGVTELAPVEANAGTGDFYSTGASLAENEQFGSLGCLARVTGTFDTANFDFIVQTAITDSTTWMDLTSSRENAIDAVDTYRIAVVDPVLDLVRLRITGHGGGTPDIFVTVTWQGDKLPVLL